MKVKDCMCDSVVWLTPETSVCDCAKLMCEQHIGRIPVCDKNQNVVGLNRQRYSFKNCSLQQRYTHY